MTNYFLLDSRMSNKANWCDTNVKHLFDIYKKEIDDGNRSLGLYATTCWKNISMKKNQV
jgi:hypothetical protein